MEAVAKFLADTAHVYRTDFWFYGLALALFGVIGFGGEQLPVYIFFYGNRKKAEKYDHQMYGFQGFCRFFFWLTLIVNAPLAILAVGYMAWEWLGRHL